MRVLSLTTALLLLPLSAFAAPGAPPPGCSAAPLTEAARELVHEGAEVVEVDSDVALVLAPIVYPGVRHRLVHLEGAWCDAMRAAWTRDPAVFATAAAAPWFDDVRILERADLAGGVTHLTTHARTNGVVAEWTVVSDAKGIQRAAWTAVAFAVEPFVAETEGLTALPGFGVELVRGPDGTLAPTRPLLPRTTSPNLGIVADDRMPDGFRIQHHASGVLGFSTGFYPTIGSEALVHDLIRNSVRENYEEFLTWGLVKGWSRPLGHVYVDDDIAAQCLACVFIAQDFNIHISSAVVPALLALGFSYPDDRAAMRTVIGHEMFHNWQNAYSKPGGGVTMGGAYTEGLARAQETFHVYSEVSHQDDSLVYATNANGCNDELGAQITAPTLFDGPSTGQTYSACDFWLTWYGQHGVAGVVDALEASFTHRTKVGWEEFKLVVEDAAGAPIQDDLARFGASILTGARLTWGPASGSGPTLDWSQFLDGWIVPKVSCATCAPGASTTRTIRDGGMVAARFEQNATLIATTHPAVFLYVVGEDGTIAPTASGAPIVAPAWALAVHPGVGAQNVTLGTS